MTTAQSLIAIYHAKRRELDAIASQMASTGEIVQDGVSVPIYRNITDTLMAERDRPTHCVLQVLANHADEFGYCFPGIKTIMDTAGYAASTVEASLNKLMTRDWIRAFAIADPLSGNIRFGYRLSPNTLWIRYELREEAWEHYNRLKKCNTVMDLKTKVSQPTTGTNNRKPTTRTNYKEPTTGTPTPPNREKEGLAENSSASNNPANPIGTEIGTEPRDKPNSEAHSEPKVRPNKVNTNEVRRDTPPSSAPPPPPVLPDGFDPQLELADAQSEAAAKDLFEMLPTLLLGNARKYVVRYGPDRCLATARLGLSNPMVRNPVGWMDHQLRRGLITEADQQRAEDADCKTKFGGKYADFLDQ